MIAAASAESPAKVASPPGRWSIPLALLITTLINWLDRSGISLALPFIAHESGWTTAEIGAHGAQLISMFFVGYGLSNMLLSPFAERFGPRRSIALAIVVFSLCTALNAPLGGTVAAMVALRFILGIGEGIHFPMASAIVSRWFPPGERSRANGMWIFGPQLAVIAGPPLMVVVMTAWGWRAMFVVLGAAGLLIALPAVLRFVRDNGPLAAPAGTRPRESALAAFRRFDYWLILIAGCMSNVILFGLLTWLPTYLSEGRHVPFADLGKSASYPYWAGALAIPFWAWLGDRLNTRALFASIGCGVAGIAVYFAAHAPTLTATVIFLSISIFFQDAYQTAEFAFVQRILPPERVGAGTGLYNGLAVIVGGAGGTALVGKVVEATGSYDTGLMVVVAAGIVNAVVLAVLARRIRY
jgi:MFS family permease